MHCFSVSFQPGAVSASPLRPGCAVGEVAAYDVVDAKEDAWVEDVAEVVLAATGGTYADPLVPVQAS